MKPTAIEHDWISVRKLPKRSMKVEWICEDGVKDIGFFYLETKTFRTWDLRSQKAITHWKPTLTFKSE